MSLPIALAIFCAVVAFCAIIAKRFDDRAKGERRLTPPPSRAVGWRGR
jgi:hypothetical protein